MQQIYRQGDVGFLLVQGDMSPGLRKTRKKTRVIRKGEHGGVHAIAEKAKVDYFTFGGISYVRTFDLPVEIVHNEHKTLVLPPKSLFEVRIQRELQEDREVYVRD